MNNFKCPMCTDCPDNCPLDSDYDTREHSADYYKGRADAFADCILKNGEYCWQECCETEHCKECMWLGNGDTIWFEQMQKGEE